MKHIDIKEVFADKSLLNTTVTVCGWVRTARNSKNVAFIELNDGTTLKHIQIVVDKESGIDFEDALKLGSSLKVEGTVVEGRNEVPEINAKSITVIESLYRSVNIGISLALSGYALIGFALGISVGIGNYLHYQYSVRDIYIAVTVSVAPENIFVL